MNPNNRIKTGAYCAGGIVNQLFAKYPVNIKQYVLIGKTKFDVDFINCGVPEGSFLVSLLYLIHANDVSKSTNVHILSCADKIS